MQSFVDVEHVMLHYSISCGNVLICCLNRFRFKSVLAYFIPDIVIANKI